MLDRPMHLIVPTMDAVVVDVAQDGRVRLDGEDFHAPTRQARRAILHAARQELEALTELVGILEGDSGARTR